VQQIDTAFRCRDEAIAGPQLGRRLRYHMLYNAQQPAITHCYHIVWVISAMFCDVMAAHAQTSRTK
jgi:hypothetical protein